VDPVATGILAGIAGAAAGYLGAQLRRGHGGEAASVSPVQAAPASDGSLERIVTSLPAPMLLVEGNGYIKAINDAAAELVGADAQRARGRALIEVIASVDLERLVRRALAGEPAEATIVLREAGGERHLLVSATPLGGDPQEALVSLQDRSKVADSERVRRDFLADISHELRTPVSSIRLMIETIQLSGDDPEALRIFLPNVVLELERMTRMIEDLLTLARSESGAIPLHRTNVDLSAVVADAAAAFKRRAEEQEIDLEIAPAGRLDADVDAERIRQVVANLVDNALRHTPAGGHVRVELSARGGDAILRVRDDGVGIPFKDLPHVFERFYVVDRSRSRGSGGTGLGLAIVKQIVEGHGGSVHVDSELGSGTAFSCRIPLDAAEH
jgi:two-component system phosphate regulon sensor histidine kinase PhoR